MTRFRSTLALLVLSGFLAASCPAQSSKSSPSPSQDVDLLSLSRKIDEQNTKIDLLSQQILRLQQEIEHPRTGTPLTSTATLGDAPSPVPTAGGSTHVVAPGETLISIAKMHKVGVAELQKFNHIEDERKLQIGRTLIIPGVQIATPPVSPSPAAPNG
ncbi:MAG TPA: LysM domain-containing protein [Chthoniobacterales bacterium]|jgi:LysM repeat protein|nr:LysM domain-containing protein [Chthoniobacterales bacterium]